MLHVGDAGQLHENLVRPLLRDVRLGHAQLVHTPVDGLPRLDDRIGAQLVLDVGLHREGVAAVGPRTAIEAGRKIGGPITERRVLRRRDALDPNLGNGRRGHHRRDVAHAQRFAQLLGRLIRLQPQRIIGFDAQHQMDAALQIETELELLLLHPGRRRPVVHRRDDRIDADRREDDEHNQNRDDLRANVLVHDELPLPSGATGSCPW